MFYVKSARILLRPLSEEDEALFCALYTDSGTMRFIGTPMSVEQARNSFRKVLALAQRPLPSHVYLAIADRRTRRPLGICSIQKLDAQVRRAEAGVMLLPESRSQGLAREALDTLITEAFAMLPVDEIWVEFSVDHLAARGTAVELGFAPTAAAAHEPGSKLVIWSVHRHSWHRNAERVQLGG